MDWFDVIYLAAIFGTVGWLYLKHGWRAGYRIGPSGEVVIQHDGRPLAVREMRSKMGWPIMALIEIPFDTRSRFSIRLQPRIRLGAEIEVGHAAFDDMFLISGESLRLAHQLSVRVELRGHFIILPARLKHDHAKLSRVVGEDGKLALEINVRWTGDRPRLYRALLVWLVELELLLSTDAQGNASKPGRDSVYDIGSYA